MAMTKFKCYISHQLFPHVGGIAEDQFGIVKIKITDLMTAPFICKKDGKPKKTDITLKGNFPIQVSMGVEYTVLANIKEDGKYGDYYEVQCISRSVDFDKIKDPRSFFKAVLMDDKVVDEIFDTLPNPIEAFKNGDIEALCKVKGIGEYRAIRILNKCAENIDFSEAYEQLLQFGIGIGIIRRICLHYGNGSRAVKIVKSDPYRLAKEIKGVGFKTADSIAMALGLSRKSVERIKSFIVYRLEKVVDDNGDSYVTAGELQMLILNELGNDIKEVLEDGTTNIYAAITQLVEEGILVIEPNISSSRRRVYLKKIYSLEKNISDNLKRLMAYKPKGLPDGWEQRVKIQEEIQGYAFDEDQWRGIEQVLKNSVNYITGYGGTGKSSVVAGVLAALGPTTSFAQCALAGKAAARLQEVTKAPGKTIHRLLEYKVLEGEFGFSRNEANPLDEKVIILDELSLVSGELFLDLLKAIRSGSKLIMLGDNGQLPSIGKLNLATDIFESPVIPTVSLTKIHRQAAESGIKTCSIEIRKGIKQFEDGFVGDMIAGNKKDMIFSMDDSAVTTLDRTLDWFEKLYDGNIMNIQVLSPVKERGESCVKNLNKYIREIVNPPSKHTGENILMSKQENYYIGDKVMVTCNNYHTVNKMDCEVPIFNGWTGIIKDITKDQSLIIDFPIIEDTIVMGKPEALDCLMLGYCCSVHKAQGSDIPIVIGVIDYTTPFNMLSRSLVYTLITRAKDKCVLVGQTQAINAAIATDAVNYKRTFLQELLLEGEKNES